MEEVPFADKDKMKVNKNQSLVFSNFYPELEKSNGNEELKVYASRLGQIEPGYEWLAFTFSSQEMNYSKEKLESFLEFSESQLQDAYSRMKMPEQSWTKGTQEEVNFILSQTGISHSDSILDFGCGQGRHSLELSKRGYNNVTGIDFSETNVAKARSLAISNNLMANFLVADARKLRLGVKSRLILCLYDVIGSFRDNADNIRIVRSIKHHLQPGGKAVISVMNMELTESIAIHKDSISNNPHSLLSLPPSSIMASSGNVFRPDYFLINTDDGLVYRKEQFADDDDVYAEYVVADKRYTMDEICSLFQQEGFIITTSRYVQAGHWSVPLMPTDPKAKEILLVVQNK